MILVLRRLGSGTGLIGGAILANLALLLLMGILTSQHRDPPAMSDPVGVSLVSLAPPEPPPAEEVKEEAPPPPQSKPDFAPDLVQPSLGDFGTGGISVNLQLGDVETTAGEQEFIFDSVDLDQPPRVLVQVPPEYPYRAREQGIEGYVAVKLLVREDGSVARMNVLKAQPEGLFEDAVRRAVPGWKFQPGKIAGEPVTAWIVTTIRFDLQ